MKTALFLLVLLAAPASSQVYDVGELPPGPVVFVLPQGFELLATEAALTGPRAGVATETARFFAVRGHGLELAFYDDDRNRIDTGGALELELGDVAYRCAFLTFEGERVGVEVECGCLDPDLPTLAPGAVSWSVDDPDVLRLEPESLCEAG